MPIDVCSRSVLHILMPESKFSKSLIESIQRERERETCAEKHFFVICDPKIYEYIKKYDKYDVLFYENLESDVHFQSKLIKKYGEQYTWIVLHGLFSPWSALYIPRRFYKKIIWRTWGHDVGLSTESASFIKHFAKVLLNKYAFLSFANGIRAIAIENIVDLVALQRIGVKNAIYCYSYCTEKSNYSLPLRKTNKNTISDGTLNVMVEHSVHGGGCHFEEIDLLKKFKGENVRFYFPLSYGPADQKNEIIRYAKASLGKDQVVILDHFMEYNEYCDFLDKINVAIFAGKGSYALGNIGALIHLGKTFYLRKSGVLAEAFEKKNIPFRCIDDLPSMSFEDFSDLLGLGSSNLSVPTGSDVGTMDDLYHLMNG